MAGIGFELKKVLAKKTLLSKTHAYGYSALISSGAWILSILSILRVGFFASPYLHSKYEITQFQVSITYLIDFSLILSGIFQYSFCRFAADQLYVNKEYEVSSNLNGVLFILTALSGTIGFIIISFFFQAQPLIYKLLMLGGFVLLCNIWVLSGLLSSIKEYQLLVLLFFISYMLVFCLAVFFKSLGLNGLLAGFIIGQALLFFGLLTALHRYYPLTKGLSLSFIANKQLYFSLILTGVLYNTGVWMDKLIFWFNPLTSQAVIGPVRASNIYDLPIFIAYLGNVPSMAYFLLKMETDFSFHCKRYYDAISTGGTMQSISQAHTAMVSSAKQGIQTIFKIQTIVVLCFALMGMSILHALSISVFYIHLLVIDSISVSLQMVLLALLNILFYLDKRNIAAGLCLLLTIGNALLTYLSIQLGPFYFGYGFAIALLCVVAICMKVVDRGFNNLTYQTFMLQSS